MLLVEWLVVEMMTAVAVHVAFVLFAPAYRFSLTAGAMAGPEGANHFVILKPEDQVQLFPALPRHSVVGACLYDVARGNVRLDANVPAGQWVTAIYSSRGKLLYSVNNRQSGADSFSVSVGLAPGFLEVLLQSPDAERPEIDSGWTVMSPESRGLAVIWYPLTDAAQRDSIAEALSRSRCAAEGTPPSQ